MWTTILIGMSPIAPFGRVSPVLHVMVPIGPFRVSLRVVNLRVVVAIGVAVAIRVVVVIRPLAPRAIKEERERCTDVGRSAQRRPLRKKKTSGTPLTLQWLSFLRES